MRQAGKGGGSAATARSQWLQLLLSVSFGEDGQVMIVKLRGAVELLADLAQSMLGENAPAALLILHSVCFCSSGRAQVLSCGRGPLHTRHSGCRIYRLVIIITAKLISQITDWATNHSSRVCWCNMLVLQCNKFHTKICHVASWNWGTLAVTVNVCRFVIVHLYNKRSF